MKKFFDSGTETLKFHIICEVKIFGNVKYFYLRSVNYQKNIQKFFSSIKKMI